MGAPFGLRLCTLAAVILGSALLLSHNAGAEQDRLTLPKDSYSDLVRRWQMLLVRDPHDVRRVVRNGQPTLLAFVDKSCGHCLAMVPVIEELQKLYDGRLNIATVDNEQADIGVRLLLRDYQVWSVPMFVVIDRQGQIYRKLYGPQATQRLTRLLEQVLGPL